jgi:exosortase
MRHLHRFGGESSSVKIDRDQGEFMICDTGDSSNRTESNDPIVFTTRLLFLCVLPLTVAWRPLAATFSLAWRDDAYMHILLILPITAALILLEWRPLKPTSRSSPRAGTVLLIVAVLVAGFVSWASAWLQSDVQRSLSMLALVMWWIGAFVLSFGTRVSRSLLFPLGFLFWIVPFPGLVLNSIVSFLQQGSTLAAHILFTAVSVPVTQDGVRLSIPGLTVEVAKECSSIRSSLMLLVATMVLAHLLLRTPWRRALVIATVVPLSVAKNGLRIFTISMLGTRVDPGFLEGRLHRDGGIVFFAIALGLIFVLLWISRRTEDPELPRSALNPVGSVL